MEKQYIKDRWGERTLIIGYGGKDIVAIGEVLDRNAERFFHFNTEDFIRIAKVIIKEQEEKENK